MDLVLGGKCRDCATRISPIYPAIELVTALLLLAAFFKFGLTFDFLVYAVGDKLLEGFFFELLRYENSGNRSIEILIKGFTI